MSQAQLALPELSDSYVSLIESGKRTPAPNVVEMLARKLDCSPTYLVSGVAEEAATELRMTLEYAEIALQNGAATEARDRFAEVLGNPETAAVPGLRHRAQWGYALALEATGDLEAAIVKLRKLVAESSPEADRDGWARLHIVLIRCLRERGDLTASVQVGEEALSRIAKAGTESTDSVIELAVTVLGSYIERGDLVRSRQLAVRLIERAETVGSPRSRMAAYWQAAVVAKERGEYAEGITLAERALALLGEGDDTRNLSRLRLLYAITLLRAGSANAERARALLLQVKHEISENPASEIDMAYCLAELARVEIILGRPDEAVTLVEDAVGLLGDAPRSALGASLAVLGEAFVSMGRRDDAVATLTRAAEYLEETEATREAAQTWFNLAELFGEIGSLDEQANAYRRALACVGL